ncbi:hypothetical protein DID80_01730 [Candidatus Marinamargulisbacteria bacterium SCGC AAA071-K20]|nr:hypothetical protein DID80_01730 [Candidatus Marinamargulisbacteria bacterium SCGC AAA071-K20]
MTLSKENASFLKEKYTFFSDPNTIKKASKKLCKLLPSPSSYDRLVGVELGSVALASLLSLNSKKPSLLLRKASKKYGTLKLIEGNFNKHETVVIIEDVLHSEEQISETLEKLETAELNVHSIITYKNFLSIENFKNIPIISLISEKNEV